MPTQALDLQLKRMLSLTASIAAFVFSPSQIVPLFPPVRMSSVSSVYLYGPVCTDYSVDLFSDSARS